MAVRLSPRQVDDGGSTHPHVNTGLSPDIDHDPRFTDISPPPPVGWTKLNEWGFRPPLCTYRLKWSMRTSWGWWDEWDDTSLQTQDSKFEPWVWGRSRYLSVTEAPHNSESFRVSGEETFYFLEIRRPEWRSHPRSSTFQTSSFNHCCTRATAPLPLLFSGVWHRFKK